MIGITNDEQIALIIFVLLFCSFIHGFVNKLLSLSCISIVG